MKDKILWEPLQIILCTIGCVPFIAAGVVLLQGYSITKWNMPLIVFLGFLGWAILIGILFKNLDNKLKDK